MRTEINLVHADCLPAMRLFTTFRTVRLRVLCIQLVILIYLSLIAFAVFNYCNHCAVTLPSSLVDKSKMGSAAQNLCELNFQELGVQDVNKYDEPTEEEIITANPQVHIGGAWAPSDCQSWQKVAIIVPYRNRLQPLRLLLRRLHPMLRKQKLDYRIFIVEQAGDGEFNRGKLFNVGYIEAGKFADFNCFVFHDADLLPEDDRNLYMCDNHGRHLETATDDVRYHLKYYNYAGGVIAINSRNFFRINGFPNLYWGWGNEDDDFSARITESGLLLTRPPELIGRYQMVPHRKNTRSSSGNGMFFGWQRRWPTDGLKDPVGMNYSVIRIDETPLYTRILVDIGSPPPDMSVYTQRHEQDISLWWFLTFYYP